MSVRCMKNQSRTKWVSTPVEPTVFWFGAPTSSVAQAWPARVAQASRLLLSTDAGETPALLGAPKQKTVLGGVGRGVPAAPFRQAQGPEPVEGLRLTEDGSPYLGNPAVTSVAQRTLDATRTIGDQLSPPSADAYTCPPLVPKYTPHGSRESTDIASRSTLT